MDVKKMKENAPKGSLIEKMSEKDIERLLTKQINQDERTKFYGAKKRVSDMLYVHKAKQAGIKVSEEEVVKVMRQKGYIK